MQPLRRKDGGAGCCNGGESLRHPNENTGNKFGSGCNWVWASSFNANLKSVNGMNSVHKFSSGLPCGIKMFVICKFRNVLFL